MASPTRKSVSYGERTAASQVLWWRKSLGLTQGELERRAGLGHNTISRIEQSEVSPRIETIEKIAEALSITVEQLQFSDPVPRIEEPGDTPESVEARIAQLPVQAQAKVRRMINDVLDLFEGV